MSKLNLPYIKIITKIILYATLLCAALALYSFLFARIVGGGVATVPPDFTSDLTTLPPPKRFSLLGGIKSISKRVIEGSKSILWRRKQLSVIPSVGNTLYTSRQRERLTNILENLMADEALCQDARLTNWRVDEELVLRYLDSADWGDTYHGKSFEDTIREAIQWRKHFGVHLINITEVDPVLSTGVAYVRNLDQYQRPVIYIRIHRLESRVSEETYVKSIVYTLERANFMSEQSGVGSFVTIVDLKASPWISTNHMNPILALLNILKNIYPRRLGAVYIVNTGIGFRSFWNIIKRILSGKTLSKIILLNNKDVSATLISNIGAEYLEEDYGGAVSSAFDVTKYFSDFDVSQNYRTQDSRDL